MFAGGLSLPQKPETVEPNITYTHAPDVWALGFRGQGITVGGADTGQRWTHNALKPQYRGWDGVAADHNYNWHDAIHDSIGNPCGNDSPFPCDDIGHGTHTIGTAIGDDGMGNQIGMAPARNGSVVVTWIKATAHLPDTSSAWNGFLRLTR